MSAVAGSDRRRFNWIGPLLVLAWLACAAARLEAAGEYRSVEVESLRITIDSEWAGRTTPGYLPVRFDITNLGEARVIEIVGRGSRFFSAARRPQPGTTTVRQTLRLARGDRVRLTLPVPVFAGNENIRFEIHEGDRTLERFSFSGFQSGTTPASASALIVPDRGTPFGALAPGWARTPAAPAGRITSTLDFLLEPARLPTNWIGYTSLRAVVIGPEGWGQLAADQKDALLAWTAAGGDLIFVDGSLAALLPAEASRSAALAGQAVTGYFFGRIHLPTSAAVAAAGLGNFLNAAAKLQDPNWALPANGAIDWGVITARGFRLLIPGIEGVPARAYLSILILFSLLIGPVNYWILWRTRQQVLLVLTAPLISLLFIVLLAGYVAAAEGFGVHGRVLTVTMLDEVRTQAATRASASLYAAGMTPAGGLSFGRDVAVFPLGPDGSGSREHQMMDLTAAQRFSAGIIDARTPANFEQITFRPARERLGFSAEAGGISVMNGLGETITALFYRKGGTTYGLDGPLPPGARGLLKAGAAIAGTLVASDLPGSARITHLFQNQPDGSYLAVLERSPFWQPGVEGVEERGSLHLVIGWPGGQP